MSGGINEKNLALLRNMILSREFTLYSRSAFSTMAMTVGHSGRTYSAYKTDVPPKRSAAIDSINMRWFDLPSQISKTSRPLFVVHNRRAIMRDKLHASVLDLRPGSIIVLGERIVRFDFDRASWTHLYSFSSPAGDEPLDCVLREAQSSKNFNNRGVELVVLPDGYLAFTIDGWLADYSSLESIHPLNCIDYTRAQVEKAGGQYRRDKYGMFIR